MKKSEHVPVLSLYSADPPPHQPQIASWTRKSSCMTARGVLPMPLPPASPMGLPPGLLLGLPPGWLPGFTSRVRLRSLPLGSTSRAPQKSSQKIWGVTPICYTQPLTLPPRPGTRVPPPTPTPPLPLGNGLATGLHARPATPWCEQTDKVKI